MDSYLSGLLDPQTFLIMLILCFCSGVLYARVVNTSGISSHFDVLVSWIQLHTTQWAAAKDLEQLGKITGVPIVITSPSWPGIQSMVTSTIMLWLGSKVKGRFTRV